MRNLPDAPHSYLYPSEYQGLEESAYVEIECRCGHKDYEDEVTFSDEGEPLYCCNCYQAIHRQYEEAIRGSGGNREVGAA